MCHSLLLLPSRPTNIAITIIHGNHKRITNSIRRVPSNPTARWRHTAATLMPESCCNGGRIIFTGIATTVVISRSISVASKTAVAANHFNSAFLKFLCRAARTAAGASSFKIFSLSRKQRRKVICSSSITRADTVRNFDRFFGSTAIFFYVLSTRIFPARWCCVINFFKSNIFVKKLPCSKSINRAAMYLPSSQNWPPYPSEH